MTSLSESPFIVVAMTLNTTEEGVAEIIDALRDSKLNISEEGVAKLRDALRDSHNVSSDDATWILTSAFIIFTMQSGKSMISSVQLPTVFFLEHLQKCRPRSDVADCGV